ncbi:transcription elongation factor [Cypionkella aquatica]|uniref:Transcription elongation factor n=1 Tax=Cypionkella aquatica TaxID=1756042 RepID=A0AA37UBL8_9RHOB|nr:GreA/GreB family elongation factor [Cypionkella aquatica]GLS88056.1 transcription elongation factor [Cypionkella aquatica]GLS88451.1 transcription elongation factor [Cypionkella aquatica]
MSRAFVKEGDGALDPLPDLPQSPHPNHVTPRGLAALQSRLHALQTTLAALKSRTDRLDKLPEAAAERDIRYIEARLRTAILRNPATLPLTEAAFGLCITVADEDGTETRYEITGEDEADARLNRITPQSPLARALLGAQIGDEVIWRKPSGASPLTIVKIAHADP